MAIEFHLVGFSLNITIYIRGTPIFRKPPRFTITAITDAFDPASAPVTMRRTIGDRPQRSAEAARTWEAPGDGLNDGKHSPKRFR